MNILVAGCGQMGWAIGQILSQAKSTYKPILADLAAYSANPSPAFEYISVDFQNPRQIAEAARKYQIDAVISSLPYFLNAGVANVAKSLKLHYFDLTEDVEVTANIAKLAKGADTAFVPQCGVAPGFINIVAHDLMQHFEQLDTVKLRCGALPQQASNALQYALTWSLDGLINEYGNPCQAIVNRKSVWLSGLGDLEMLQVDGVHYEAFNTSGGLGALPDIYQNKINNLNYKTLRYPGHGKKMQFLMNDLKLNQDRDTLKKILLNVLPHTRQDVVIVNVGVEGIQNNQLIQESYSRKFYPSIINNQPLSAIQSVTASSACAVMDLILQNRQKYRGFVHQWQFSLQDFLNSANRLTEIFISH